MSSSSMANRCMARSLNETEREYFPDSNSSQQKITAQKYVF